MPPRRRPPLNQWAISRILGSEMRPAGGRSRFGRFSLLPLLAEGLSPLAVQDEPRSGDVNRGSLPTLVQAFIDTRRGLAVDRFLADPSLTGDFHKRAYQLGIDASPAAMNRRLMSIRKNPAFYGIKIPSATREEPLDPNIFAKLVATVEFAVTKTRRMYGATVDDVLEEPAIGDQFDELCGDLSPGWKPVHYRLVALNLRKTRFMKQSEASLFEALDISELDAAMTDAGSLADPKLDNIPSGQGLVELSEPNHSLYVVWHNNVSDVVDQLRNPRLLSSVTGPFWSPQEEELTLRTVTGAAFKGVRLTVWERRMIQIKTPVFNLPVSSQRNAA